MYVLYVASVSAFMERTEKLGKILSQRRLLTLSLAFPMHIAAGFPDFLGRRKMGCTMSLILEPLNLREETASMYWQTPPPGTMRVSKDLESRSALVHNDHCLAEGILKLLEPCRSQLFMLDSPS